MISKVRDFDYTKIRTKIDELCVTNMFFNGNTVKLMKEIVPEYISQNSSFSELDEEIIAEERIIEKSTSSEIFQS